MFIPSDLFLWQGFVHNEAPCASFEDAGGAGGRVTAECSGEGCARVSGGSPGNDAAPPGSPGDGCGDGPETAAGCTSQQHYCMACMPPCPWHHGKCWRALGLSRLWLPLELQKHGDPACPSTRCPSTTVHTVLH